MFFVQKPCAVHSREEMRKLSLECISGAVGPCDSKHALYCVECTVWCVSLSLLNLKCKYGCGGGVLLGERSLYSLWVEVWVMAWLVGWLDDVSRSTIFTSCPCQSLRRWPSRLRRSCRAETLPLLHPATFLRALR